MNVRTTTVLTLTIALVAGLSPVASAWNHDELPTIASGGGPGAGWVAFKFSTDGSIVAFEANANNLAGSAQAGGYLFDENDNIIFGFTFTGVGFPTDGTLLDVTTPATGNVHLDTRASGPGGGGIGIGVTMNDGCTSGCSVGTFKMLIWVAGNAQTWDYHMRGGAGDALLGTTSGSSAFLYGAEDFRGTAYAQSYTSGIGGRAAADTHKVVNVQNKLFGVYYDANFKIACAAVCVGAPGTSVLTATEPSGQTSRCFGLTICSWQGAGAGTYDFAYSGADASETAVTPFVCQIVCAGVLPWQDSIILGGVDAALPS